MNRERIAWLLSFLLLVIVTFRISPSLAQRDNDYAFVRTLVDIHRQVQNNYVESVDGRKLEDAAIDGMLAELDPFTMYVPPAKREEFDRMLEGTFEGVGIQLNQLDNGRIEVVTPIDGSPAVKAGVMAGDIILKVNGEAIEGMRLPDVIKRIKGEAGTQVTLTVRHLNGDEADLTMERQEVVLPTVKGFRRADDNTWDWYILEKEKIAYMRITQFTPDTFKNVEPVLRRLVSDGMAGLVLDLRFNPGGQLDQAIQLVDLFIDHGTIVATRGRNRPEDRRTASVPGTLPYFPLIVLVNEHSASASEIVAGSLKDNGRAVVIGARSYGKGSVQEVIPLDGSTGGELKLTVAYYYLPSGRLVHRKKDAKDWGVEPDITVPMSDEAQRAVLQGRQEQELFRRPTTVPSTRQMPAASTRPTDVQLERAVETMVALTVVNRQRLAEAAPPTRPSTQPVR